MITKKYRIGIITALLFCSAVIFFATRTHPPRDRVFLQAVPVKTPFGWGYNIMADDKIYIHQDYMPAVPGKQGFKSSEDALLVGRRVIQKITRNELPAITEKDLQELGVLKK
jgi:hypothetical protein